MTDKPDPKPWDEYLRESFARDPHGLGQEAEDVWEATRGYWSVGLAWEDGSPVEGIIYLNYGLAIKAARRYNFLLPDQNVRNHERLKALRDAGQPEPFVEPSKRPLRTPPK